MSNNIVVSKSTSSGGSGSGLTLAQLNAIFLTRSALTNYTGNISTTGTMSASSISSTSLSVTNTLNTGSLNVTSGSLNVTNTINTAVLKVNSTANPSLYVQSSGTTFFSCNALSKMVNTFSNTLDDGNGNAIFNSASGIANSFVVQRFGSTFFSCSASTRAVNTIANQLDDGNGNMVLGGSLGILSPSLLSTTTITTAASSSYPLILPPSLPSNNGTALVSTSSGALTFDIPGLVASGTITSAQMLSLATPILLIAAPGAGFIIRIVTWDLHYVYGGTPYTGGATIYLNYGTSHIQTYASNTTSNTGNFTLSGDSYSGGVGSSGSGVSGINTATIINQAIYMYSNSFVGGNGTINWRIRYYIEAITI